MPGYHYTYPSETSSELYSLMQSTCCMKSFRQIQTVYLRAKFGYLPLKIAQITGLSESYIRHIHADYKKRGTQALILGNKGGRHHSYLSIEEEASFLAQFKQQAEAGSIIQVRKIINAYETLIGKRVHPSMMYKLLHRHGWRKLSPRPHHPNQDVEAMETFKKTSLHSSRKQANRQK